MRRVKRLSMEVENLRTELNNTKQKGVIAAGAAGGIIIGSAITSMIQKRKMKSDIEQVATSVGQMQDVMLALCDKLDLVEKDETEEEEEAEDDSTSNTKSTKDESQEVTTTLVDEKKENPSDITSYVECNVSMSDGLKRFVSSLKSIDFSDGYTILTEVLRGLIMLAWGENDEKDVIFSHVEPTVLNEGRLIGKNSIDFMLYEKNNKYRITIKDNSVFVK